MAATRQRGRRGADLAPVLGAAHGRGRWHALGDIGALGGGQGVEVAPARADPPPSLGQLPEFLYSICDVEFLYSICNVEFVEFVM